MADRRAQLDRLTTSFQCSVPWESMREEGQRRFCDQCQRPVFDFAELTEREIHAQLQASRGKLCARLTKIDGRLVTLPPLQLPTPPLPPPRRASPLAASLVTALLSVGTARAEGPADGPLTLIPSGESAERGDATMQQRQPRSTETVALHGRLVNEAGAPLSGAVVTALNALDGSRAETETNSEGAFWFAELSEGLYSVEGQLVDFLIERSGGLLLHAGEQETILLSALPARGGLLGDVAVPVLSLRELVETSDLAVVAAVGPSVVLEASSLSLLVATELSVERRFKGGFAGASLAYLHHLWTTDEGGPIELHPDLPRGRVLAFLREASETQRVLPQAAFEAAGLFHSMLELEGAELNAYTRRLEALVGLEKEADRRGELAPEALAEWLVATAEQEATRGEVVRELRAALDALEHCAARQGVSTEVAAAELRDMMQRRRARGGALGRESAPALVAAALSEAQRQRITAALHKTKGYDGQGLFSLVRRFDRAAAVSWLLEELRPDRADAAGLGIGEFAYLAGELESGALSALVSAANERLRSARNGAAAEYAELLRGLGRDFARLLAEEH